MSNPSGIVAPVYVVPGDWMVASLALSDPTLPIIPRTGIYVTQQTQLDSIVTTAISDATPLIYLAIPPLGFTSDNRMNNPNAYYPTPALLAEYLSNAAKSTADAAASAAAAAAAAGTIVGEAAVWVSGTFYHAGAAVLAPDGTPITRIADGTSRSTFDSTEQAAWYNALVHTGTMANTALSATYVAKTPTVGSYTYSNGNVTQDPDGITYTYNSDGTLHTETIPQPGGGTVTRTYSYNSDGTISGVA